MACKCTQTTTNATGGGAITSALSACSYVFWYNQMSGCTGSALDTHNGNPGANILFQLGINDNGYPVEAYGTNNISIDNPNPLHRFSIGNQGNIDVEEYIHFGDGALTGNTGNNKTGTVGDVYLGYRAGYTRGTNWNSGYNTIVGAKSLGSTGVLNAALKNTALGYQTMVKATSASENVVIGNDAGAELTTGSRNVLIGVGQGKLITTQNDILRIGNKPQTAGGSARPLIQGDFATSATTLWGSARITDLPAGLGPLMGIDKHGYLHVSKFKPTPAAPLEPLGFNNMGVWTANTVDASTSNGCDPADAGCDPGYWDTTGTIPGYRSVSISGGTNHQATSSDWAGTRVGIGTQFPEVPLHVKSPYAWIRAQSEVGASYIESRTATANAYVGVGAGNGVGSGSTTWRMHATTTNFGIKNWKTGVNQNIGTGFTIHVRSQSNGDEVVTNILSAVGDNISNNLDGAIVARSDENPLGGVSTNPTGAVGIFTPIPTKELTLVGAFSGTGSIHSTNYMKWPDAARSMYLGYGINSGTTTSIDNTFIGYQAASDSTLDAAASNTAVGTQALKALETGDRNVVVGHAAASTLTSGADNIAIGVTALGSSSDSDFNVAIGSWALLANNTDASNNVAIGYRAQTSNASGNENIGIGSDTQYSLLSGTFNTAVGTSASYHNQTGKGNAALGHHALKGGGAAKSNSWNSSVGSGSLSGITTGGCNVAVGNNAGAGVTGGVGSTITTGSNNIVIGCQIDVKGGTDDNQINIGGIVLAGIGTGDNTIWTHRPQDPIKTHDVYGRGDMIIKPTVGLIVSASTQGMTVESDIRVPDSKKLKMGAGEDIEIYSDGTGGRIDVGSSYLQVAGDTIDFVDGGAVQYILRGSATGGVSLYHAASKKFEVTAAGGTLTGDLSASGKVVLSSVATSYIIGDGGGGNNDVEIHSANDVEVKSGDDINLEATGRVEFTQFGAGSASMGIDLNDTPTHAYIENYAGNEVVGINGSTRRLYFLYSGSIPTGKQHWISGEESGGANLTLASTGRIDFSASTLYATTKVGVGRSAPVSELDVVYSNVTSISNDTGGGDIVTFGSAGADYAAGFLVQLRGASNWVKADADDTTQQGSLLGIALGAAPSNGILLKGFYKLNTANDVTTWTNGGQLYVSTVDGQITESTGSMGSGDYVRVVGYMTTTSGVMYFNPESTYVVIT